MPYDPQKHHRRSIRLKGYDYARAGAYFLTIVTQHRECRFGEIVNGEMRLNEAGRMAEKWWLELNHKFPTVDADEYVVMPNHFHGVVVLGAHDEPGARDEPGAHDQPGAHVGAPLPDDVTDMVDVGADLRVSPNPRDNPTPHGNPAAHDENGDAHVGRDAHVGAPLPTIVQWFKTMTTNEYIRGVKQLGWPPFPGKLWQRNYYEHIIRDETALDRIRQYIANNPARWLNDAENPAPARKMGSDQ